MRTSLLFLALAFSLLAEDKPDPRIAQLEQQLAEQKIELTIYQQGLFQCQAAAIHAQAQTQASKAQTKPNPAKESK